MSTGNRQEVGELYLHVKHMFLYRDPITNIASMLNTTANFVSFGYPRWAIRKVAGHMLSETLKRCGFDHWTKENLTKDMTPYLDGKDDHIFDILQFILSILCYVNAKEKLDVHTIKYENLLSNPKGQLEKIVQLLNKSKENIDYAGCLKALNKDSQAKSKYLCQKRLAPYKNKNVPTQAFIEKIDSFLQKYGLPPSNKFDDIFVRQHRRNGYRLPPPMQMFGQA